MKLQYFWGQPVYGVTSLGNTGDGIRMCQAVGADIWHMWHFHGGYGFKFPDYPFAFRHPIGGPLVPTRKMPWILLDRYGRRYMNEYPPAVQDTGARDMLMYDPVRTEYPRIPSMLLFDEDGRKIGPLAQPIFQGNDHPSYEWSEDNLKEVERGWIHKAQSRSDLAEQLGVDVSTLSETLDKWNSGYRSGHDAEYGRVPGTMMRIETPPFFWIEVWPVVNNTQGGPRHDEHRRILHVNGHPIPRLYSAGENGSVFGHLYLEAGNAAECFVSGRQAAAHLATLPSLDSSSVLG
jgi:succinate dehydrogenase/fumarate reductase flavoprotein subunit